MPRTKEYLYRIYSYLPNNEGIIAQSNNLEFLKTRKRLMDKSFSQSGMGHFEGKVFIDSSTYNKNKIVIEELTKTGWKKV